MSGKEAALGQQHPSTLASLESLASLQEAMGKDVKAEPLRRRLLENSENRLGHTHPHTNLARARLATTLEALGRVEEAEALKSCESITVEMCNVTPEVDIG